MKAFQIKTAISIIIIISILIFLTGKYFCPAKSTNKVLITREIKNMGTSKNITSKTSPALTNVMQIRLAFFCFSSSDDNSFSEPLRPECMRKAHPVIFCFSLSKCRIQSPRLTVTLSSQAPSNILPIGLRNASFLS